MHRRTGVVAGFRRAAIALASLAVACSGGGGGSLDDRTGGGASGHEGAAPTEPPGDPGVSTGGPAEPTPVTEGASDDREVITPPATSGGVAPPYPQGTGSGPPDLPPIPSASDPAETRPGIASGTEPPDLPPASSGGGTPTAPQGVTAGTGARVETLAVAWEYRAASGKVLLFPGLVDGAGVLYWLECDQPSYTPCDVVAVSRDGTPRWRQRAGEYTEHSAMLLHGGHVVYLNGGPSAPGGCFPAASIEARRTSDGSLAWSASLAGALASASASAGDPCATRSFGLAAGGGRVYVAAEAWTRSGTPLASRLLAFDVASGMLAGAFPAPLPPGALSARWYPYQVARDAAGNLFGTVYATGGGQDGWYLAALDPAGRVRHVVRTEHGSSLAVHGSVYQSSEDAYFTADATLGVRSPSGDLQRAPPRLFADIAAVVDRGVVSLGCPAPTGDIYCLKEMNVYVHDRGLSTVVWQRSVGVDRLSREDGEGGFAYSSPIVTSRGTVLLTVHAHGPDGGTAPPARLLELSLGDGRVVFEAELPGGGAFAGHAALHGGRFTTQVGHSLDGVVQAYDLPGREPAARGWITAGGSMSRDHSPR